MYENGQFLSAFVHPVSRTVGAIANGEWAMEGIFTIDNSPFTIIIYSVLKLFTGLANAAFAALNATVTRASNMVAIPVSANKLQ